MLEKYKKTIVPKLPVIKRSDVRSIADKLK